MKNKSLKIGLIMTCFAMICTSMVGFTLAQYMTTNTNQDTARVAQWGVAVNTAGSLFSKTYATTGTVNDKSGNAIALSVDSNNANNIIAPGTANVGTGMTFGVTGTPEVAVNVAFTITASDIYLKKTTNVDNLIGGEGLANDYYPVEFVLNDGTTDVVTGTLAQVKTYLEGKNGNYLANTNLNTEIGSYTLTWSYAFAGNSIADTLLGNIAAGQVYDPALVDVTDYELDTTFNLTITVTQID